MGRLARVPRFAHADAALAQVPIAGPAPLRPNVAAQLAPDPLVDVAQRAQHFGHAEVRFPSKQGFPQLCHDHAQVFASCPTGQFPHPIFQLGDGLAGHLQPRPGTADREAQEGSPPGPIHRTFQRKAPGSGLKSPGVRKPR